MAHTQPARHAREKKDNYNNNFNFRLFFNFMTVSVKQVCKMPDLEPRKVPMLHVLPMMSGKVLSICSSGNGKTCFRLRYAGAFSSRTSLSRKLTRHSLAGVASVADFQDWTPAVVSKKTFLENPRPRARVTSCRRTPDCSYYCLSFIAPYVLIMNTYHDRLPSQTRKKAMGGSTGDRGAQLSAVHSPSHS